MSVMDHKTMRIAHDFWSWWSDELRSLLPGKLRGEPTERDRFDIFANDEGTVIETVHEGSGRKLQEPHALEELPQESWEQIAELAQLQKARLFLSGADILTLPVKMPRASKAQIGEAIQLQLPRLVPLEPHLLDWEFVETERNAEGVEIALIMAKSSRLDEIEALFAEHDLMPPAFCALHEVKTAILRKPLEIARQPLAERKVQFAVAALAMIAMIPLLTFGGARLMASVEEGRIERLEAALAPRLADDKQILAEEMIRRAAAPILKMPSASNRLEALAAHLPSTDWTVSAAQSLDGRFEFTADMRDQEKAKAALQKARLFKKLKPVEDMEADNTRQRIRYQVGR